MPDFKNCQQCGPKLQARGYREFSFSRSGTQAAVEMRPK
jgi:hypothetical protein